MARLKWGGIPYRAGWYWLRDRRQGMATVIVKVFKAKNGLLCCIMANGVIMESRFDEYEWAGPLPKPEE